MIMEERFNEICKENKELKDRIIELESHQLSSSSSSQPLVLSREEELRNEIGEEIGRIDEDGLSRIKLATFCLIRDSYETCGSIEELEESLQTLRDMS